jgi:hypothetical protein
MGPFLVIFLGISLVTVPEATRVLRHSPQHLRLYCVLVGAGMAVLALVWGGALLIALPRGLGELLLGKQLWRPASRLVVPFTISVMGACVIAGATAGLHALGAARRSLRAMLLSSAVFLGCGLVGAYFGGATGTVRGAALATWVGALLWWWQLGLAMRESGKIQSRSWYLFRRRPAGRHGEVARSPMPASRAGSASEAYLRQEFNAATESHGFELLTENPATAPGGRPDPPPAGYGVAGGRVRR